MPAAIPSTIVYPLIRKLGTGQDLTYEELEQVVDLLNWCIAELYMDPVIEQGLNSGHGFDFDPSTTATVAEWRIPTLNDEQDTLEIQIEAETTVDTTVTFSSVLGAGSVGANITAAGGRNWWVVNLPCKVTGDYEDIEMSVATGTATLTVYAVRGVWIPKTSLLAQRYEIESGEVDGTYIVPIDKTGLTAADQPLSAGLGRLLLHNLTQLLTRYKRRYYSLSNIWDGSVFTPNALFCPPATTFWNQAKTKIRVWPGMVERGIKARFYAKILRDTTTSTSLYILGERPPRDTDVGDRRQYRPLFSTSYTPDPTPTPEWVTGEFEIPDDLYDPGRPLPSLRIGIEFKRFNDATGSLYTTTVQVQTISIWGVW